MYNAVAVAGCGQAAGVSGEVWEGVPLPEVRLCAGAAAGLCEAAGGVLQGMPGEVPQYCAVFGEGDWGVGLF